VAAVLSFAVGSFVMARLVRQTLGALIEWRPTVFAVLASIGVGLVSWLIPTTGLLLLVEVAVLGTVYLGIAWGIGLVRTSDLTQLRRPRS
jgi:hypothetical protein